MKAAATNVHPDLLTYFRRLFAYDDWANREVLAALRKIEVPPPKSVKLLAHIAATERVWLARIRQEHQPLPVWPDFAVHESGNEIAQLPGRWREFLDALTPAELAVGVSYKNSKGESWTNSIQDILMHVVMHSAYHRGQIAMDMRDAGHTPLMTDFIDGVRRGLVE
jgi:uncharacterized damage-inducible protein DinB